MSPVRTDWKEVPGWPGYRVSSDGDVQSCKSNSGEITETWFSREVFVDKDGYRKISLHHKKRCAFLGVHVLVLICHGPQRPPGPSMGLHGNGDRSDNRIENLRWGFADDNANDRDSHRRQRRRHAPSKLSAEQVLDIRRIRKEEGTSLSKIAARFGVSKRCVHRVVLGKTWQELADDGSFIEKAETEVREGRLGT